MIKTYSTATERNNPFKKPLGQPVTKEKPAWKERSLAACRWTAKVGLVWPPKSGNSDSKGLSSFL